MRKIGELTSSAHALRFQRFLAAQGTESRLEENTLSWIVWVLDEDRVAEARDALASFQQAPASARFDAPPLPQQSDPPPARAPSPRRRPRGAERPNLTLALLLVSVFVSLSTDFGAANRDLLSWLSISNLARPAAFVLPAELLRGEIWRLWTPMFIHLSLTHLIFNMYWLWLMGGEIERVRGRGALLRAALVSGLFAHLAQFWISGPNFGGMSGVVYGLLGYVWARSRLLPQDGLWMSPQVVNLLLAWMLVGFSHLLDNLIGPMANWAHLFGLLAGLGLGALPKWWRTA